MTEQDWNLIAALYRLRNITRTADFLNTTQPTVTKRLQQIEYELGVQIAIRTTKGVTFTPEGEFVASETEGLLRHIAEIKDNIQKISSGRAGSIKLGITNSMGRYILPSLLHRYKERFPQVNFDISMNVSGVVVEQVEERQAHVGFIRGDSYNKLEKCLLSVSQAVVAYSTEIKLEDLPSLPRIQYISDSYSKKLLDDWWDDHFSVPSKVGMHVNHGDTCREMISSGLGYGIFLSPEFIDKSAALFTMPLFNTDGTPFVRANWMIWHAESYGIPLVRNFIDFIRATVRSGGEA